MPLFPWNQPKTPALRLNAAAWEQFEATPYNPPAPGSSEKDFAAEFEAAESGLRAVLEQFGRNAESGEEGDFFHDWTMPDGSRAISFEVMHRSKLKNPKLVPAIMAYLRALPEDFNVCIQGDQMDFYIYVNRNGVVVHECSRGILRAFGLAAK